MDKQKLTTLTLDEIDNEIDRIANFEFNGGGYGDPDARKADDRRLQVLIALREQKLVTSQINEAELGLPVSNPSPKITTMDKQKLTTLALDEIDNEIDRIANFEFNGGGYGDPDARKADDRRLQVLIALREQKLVTSQINEAELGLPVSNPSPKITTIVVKRAINDAEVLLRTNGATSGVDRVHTALHGYLIAVCSDAGIPYENDAPITKFFKLLRQNHPALKNLSVRQGEIEKILVAFANVIDALNPIRNKASVAHANENLLEKDEAYLVINAARTILHYLDAKFSE